MCIRDSLWSVVQTHQTLKRLRILEIEAENAEGETLEGADAEAAFAPAIFQEALANNRVLTEVGISGNNDPDKSLAEAVGRAIVGHPTLRELDVNDAAGLEGLPQNDSLEKITVVTHNEADVTRLVSILEAVANRPRPKKRSADGTVTLRQLTLKSLEIFPGLARYRDGFDAVLDCLARNYDRLPLEEITLSFRSTWESPSALLCLLYTSPSPRDLSTSRMPSSA